MLYHIIADDKYHYLVDAVTEDYAIEKLHKMGVRGHIFSFEEKYRFDEIFYSFNKRKRHRYKPKEKR